MKRGAGGTGADVSVRPRLGRGPVALAQGQHTSYPCSSQVLAPLLPSPEASSVRTARPAPAPARGTVGAVAQRILRGRSGVAPPRRAAWLPGVGAEPVVLGHLRVSWPPGLEFRFSCGPSDDDAILEGTAALCLLEPSSGHPWWPKPGTVTMACRVRGLMGVADVPWPFPDPQALGGSKRPPNMSNSDEGAHT